MPATPPVKAILVAFPEHKDCELGLAVTLGVGFTETVTTIGVPLQLFAVGVIV